VGPLGRRQVAIARESRSGLIAEAGYLENLVLAHLGRGELAEARAVGEEALDVADRVGAALYQTWVRRGMASVLMAQEGVAAALRIRALLESAETLAETQGIRIELPRILLTRARLERLAGDEASARAQLDLALRLSQEMEYPYMIRELERELA
jgi:ATP/maltotriose-dependent transcriptional regulator MalT